VLSRLLEFNPNLRPNLRLLLETDWFTTLTADYAVKTRSSKVQTEAAVFLYFHTPQPQSLQSVTVAKRDLYSVAHSTGQRSGTEQQ